MKNDKGTDITKLHGHEATKNIRALIIQSFTSKLNINGTIAIKTAITITIGVYILENLVINFSVLPLLFFASYTKSTIWEAVEFSTSRSTSHVILPVKFTPPDSISISFDTKTGLLSPVRLDVSISVSP